MRGKVLDSFMKNGMLGFDQYGDLTWFYQNGAKNWLLFCCNLPTFEENKEVGM